MPVAGAELLFLPPRSYYCDFREPLLRARTGPRYRDKLGLVCPRSILLLFILNISPLNTLERAAQTRATKAGAVNDEQPVDLRGSNFTSLMIYNYNLAHHLHLTYRARLSYT